MRTPTLIAAFALTLAGALSLAACSYLWTYKYEVSVAADVSLDAGATLVMAQAPGDAGIDTIEDPKEATTSADTRDYQDEGQVCCGPTETVSLYAFLDLNDNGSWDGGEPWGADPNNPVTIEDDSYVSTIVVENDG